MKTLDLVIGAGETAFVPGGRYFRLISTSAPVDILFKKDSRTLNESAENVEAGYYAVPPEGFDIIEVTSATAQTVKVAITRGTGGYDRTVGDVNATVVKGDTSLSVTKTIAATATLIDAGSAGRESVLLYNNGTATIYIGHSGVTTSNGLPLPVGGSLTVDKNTAALYGIVASGTQNLRALIEYTA